MTKYVHQNSLKSTTTVCLFVGWLVGLVVAIIDSSLFQIPSMDIFRISEAIATDCKGQQSRRDTLSKQDLANATSTSALLSWFRRETSCVNVSRRCTRVNLKYTLTDFKELHSTPEETSASWVHFWSSHGALFSFLKSSKKKTPYTRLKPQRDSLKYNPSTFSRLFLETYPFTKSVFQGKTFLHWNRTNQNVGGYALKTRPRKICTKICTKYAQPPPKKRVPYLICGLLLQNMTIFFDQKEVLIILCNKIINCFFPKIFGLLRDQKVWDAKRNLHLKPVILMGLPEKLQKKNMHTICAKYAQICAAHIPPPWCTV